MPSALPDGSPAPVDGRLPNAALGELGRQPFGVYLHVPFCSSRCGYCDFNTYTAAELAGAGSQVSRETFWADLAAEIRLARDVLGASARPVETVFLGGGTPTLLDAAQLGQLLEVVDGCFGIAGDAEVSIEANPESVSHNYLVALRSAGFNRISLGMQSASPHVLRILDRQHTPRGALAAADQAHRAGFGKISLDLIYGTPGESVADWAATLRAALSAPINHLSAYSLIVEEGTRLSAAVRRGELAAPDEDQMADMYELADQMLSAAGMPWYEVSNWAAPGHECRHNLGYWRSHDWWGAGPGAHSHVGGVRWWNVRHPLTYAKLVRAGASPAAARETLDGSARSTERIMLGIRLAEGLELSGSDASLLDRAYRVLDDGLAQLDGGRLVLTRQGRLLADAVVRTLLG